MLSCNCLPFSAAVAAIIIHEGSIARLHGWLQQWIQDKEVDDVMNLYDKTGSGDMNFDEFKALVRV